VTLNRDDPDRDPTVETRSQLELSATHTGDDDISPKEGTDVCRGAEEMEEANVIPGIRTRSTPGSKPSHNKGRQEVEASGASPSQKDSGDAFRDPVKIPGISPTILAFPHANALISTEFHDRYREVIHIFRRNTFEHPGLRGHVDKIDYTLKMCGGSPDEVHPSILVFCRPQEFSHLRPLLTSKVLKPQYALRKSRRPAWRSWRDTQPWDDSRPLFNLYFWCVHRPLILATWHQASLRLHHRAETSTSLNPELRMTGHLTSCGSRIEYMNHQGESAYSTLGCCIVVGGKICAITSLHAFCKDGDEVHVDNTREISTIPLYSPIYKYKAHLASRSNSIFDSSPDIPQHVLDDEEDYVIDDIKYESVGEDDDRSSSSSSYAFSEEQRRRGLTESGSPDDEDEQDLDWCLIDFGNPADFAQLRPNSFAFTDQLNFTPLLTVAEAPPPPARELKVFILTNNESPLRGMIQPGISILGGINGKGRSLVWNVVLDRGYGMYQDTHPTAVTWSS